MKEFLIKITEPDKMLLAEPETNDPIGSQFDNEVQQLVFQRPSAYKDDDMILFFAVNDANFEPINIGCENNFALTDQITRFIKLELQLAFQSKYVTHKYSNKLTLHFRPSIQPLANVSKSLPEQARVLERQTFAKVEQQDSSLIFRSLTDEIVASVSFGSGEDYLDIVLPDCFYVASGQTFELYYDSVLAGKSRQYRVAVSSDIGKSAQRKWIFTPDSSQVGKTFKTVITVHDNDSLIYKKQVQIEVVGRDETTPNVQKILLIGDSITRNMTPLMQYLESASVNDYGSSRFSFAGTCGNAPYFYEGRSSWSSSDYLSNNSENPFFNPITQKISFTAYTNRTGIIPDLVHIMLGTNDVRRITPQESVDNLQRIADQIRADWPEAYIYISPPPLTAPQDGLAETFGSRFRQEELDIKLQQLANRIYTVFSNQEKIYITPVYYGFDRLHNYPFHEVKVNPFSDQTELVISDALHPTSAGHRQMGSLIYGTWEKHHPMHTGGNPVPGTTLTNLVRHADFADYSDSNWYAAPADPQIVKSRGDGLLRASIKGTTDLFYLYLRQGLQMNTSHLYYARGSMEWDNISPGEKHMRLYFGNKQLSSANNLEQWNMISAVSTPENDGHNYLTFTWRIAPAGNHNGAYGQLKEPLLIDLTASYGPGNEPSKEWCDRNIPFFMGSRTIQDSGN